MARNGLLCADVPLRNYGTHSLTAIQQCKPGIAFQWMQFCTNIDWSHATGS